jgi:hypothetical protein
VDGERVGAAGMGAAAGVEEAGTEEGAYEALRMGGVDRLLMKLDWGGEDEESEIEDLV